MIPPPPQEVSPVPPVRPWARQPGENEEEWDRFVAFRDARRPRRLVRPGVGRTANIVELARKWRWFERVEAYDRHLQGIFDQEVESIIRQNAQEVAAEHMTMLADARELASITIHNMLQSARESGFATMKPAEAIRLAEMVVKLDRLTRDQSTENHAAVEADVSNMSVEELRTAAELARRMTEDKPQTH